ncbi:MAG: DEAD/DEAH box helicase [Pedobacter sp.]|nr:DEAD/DEAH box helicase [Pedobacter sp.]
MASIGSVVQIGKNYRIEFAYRPAIALAVKELPDRRYMYQEKHWLVPIQHREEVERFARKHGLEFGHRHVNEADQDFAIPPMPELTVDIPLKREMRPYQKTGVAYAMEKKRLIIADDMGLGKTFQSIAAITGLHHTGTTVFPCLIICPSAVKENWLKEITMATNFKGIILQESVKNTFMEFYRVGMAQFFVVNYESLKKYFVSRIDDIPKGSKLRINNIHFREKHVNFFNSVIVDESHKVKSLATKNTKFTKGICTGKETILMLTGTPVVNKPKDLVSQLGILDRMSDFGGWKHFDQHYCSGPREASNLKELNYKLNLTCFYRRNKTDEDIKVYLPDKMRQVILCDLNEQSRKEYQHAQADLESYMKHVKMKSDDQIEKSMKGEVMVRIGILKNISARGKLKDAFEFIQDIIDGGQKIVVFASLKEVISAVQERFPRSVRVTGAEDDKQKQAAVDRFQNDAQIDVIVLNLKAGGVGINGLQNVATQICFIEFGWHAAIMDQAEDRLYRMGQHSNVMCTYFLGRNTIDEWNYKLINSKRDIANSVTGAEDQTEESIIDGVINLFSTKI